MVFVPARKPPLPDSNTYASGQPVLARTGSILCDAVNFYNGFKFLRDLHSPMEIDPASDALSAGITQYVGRIYWTVHPTATYVYAGAWHTAVEATKAGTAQVEFAIYTLAGAKIDTYTVTFSELTSVGSGVEGLVDQNEGYISTGWLQSNLLDVSLYQGTEIELRVIPGNCRIYSIDLVEVYTGEL